MYEDKNMERISITVPKKFLEEFDKYLEKFGYAKRSEAIRDAMRDFFKDKIIDEDENLLINAFIIIAYNHHQRGLLDELTEVEHHSNVQIYSTMHVHVSEDNCSEVIAMRGKVKQVMEFRKKVQTIKGILMCELVHLYAYPGEGTEHYHVHSHEEGHDHTNHDHPHD
ncbi:MAG: nickel-responsive transcriptional regulator NikR [Candidatus Hodarchaeota archaeon]